MANIQDSSCGKMLRAHIPPTAERISAPFLKKSVKSKIQMYLFLDLRTNGQKPEKSWEKISLSHGECWTHNISESLREENASTLSQILQDNVPEKYYLSPKACLGILRRASERGKELPAVLKKALEQQAKISAYAKTIQPIPE